MSRPQTQDVAAFLLRIALGTMVVAHGWLPKPFVFTLPGTAAPLPRLRAGRHRKETSLEALS